MLLKLEAEEEEGGWGRGNNEVALLLLLGGFPNWGSHWPLEFSGKIRIGLISLVCPLVLHQEKEYRL